MLITKTYHAHEQIRQFRWLLSLDRYDGEKNWSTSRLRSFSVTLGTSGTSWTSTSIRNPFSSVASGQRVSGSLECSAEVKCQNMENRYCAWLPSLDGSLVPATGDISLAVDSSSSDSIMTRDLFLAAMTYEREFEKSYAHWNTHGVDLQIQDLTLECL